MGPSPGLTGSRCVHFVARKVLCAATWKDVRGSRWPIFRLFSSETSYVEIIRSKEIIREKDRDRGSSLSLSSAGVVYLVWRTVFVRVFDSIDGSTSMLWVLTICVWLLVVVPLYGAVTALVTGILWLCCWAERYVWHFDFFSERVSCSPAGRIAWLAWESEAQISSLWPCSLLRNCVGLSLPEHWQTVKVDIMIGRVNCCTN